MTYKMGKPGPGIGYDKGGNQHPFSVWHIQASFKGSGGLRQTYAQFLQKNLRVPEIDRQTGTSGKVIINFIVEKDGTTGNFRVLQTPDQSLADESLKVLSLSTWNPGYEYGMPVRSYFTMPINYTVSFGR